MCILQWKVEESPPHLLICFRFQLGTHAHLLFCQILVPVAILGHLDVGATGAPFEEGECCKVASSISSVGPESCCADTPLVLAAADPVADAGLLMVGPHLVVVVVGRWQLLAMQLPLP